MTFELEPNPLTSPGQKNPPPTDSICKPSLSDHGYSADTIKNNEKRAKMSSKKLSSKNQKLPERSSFICQYCDKNFSVRIMLNHS